MDKKLTANEEIKERSNYLRGDIVSDLVNADPFVSNSSNELLKFHGTYQGFNRDSATKRKKAGLDKEYEFMVRLKLPAGIMSAKQYLAMDDLADKYSNGTIRITTRQTFQFHCILKKNLKKSIAEINAVMLSTLATCGDVVRNVIVSPTPIQNIQYKKLRGDAIRIAEFCTPKTSAYREIFMDKNDAVQQDEEPLYSKNYLPRKFKIGLILPEDNSIDVFSHDLGIILVFDGDEFKGYNFHLGGGLGMNHNQPATYPRLADPIAFIGKEDLTQGVKAVIELQRDHGDRTNRKHARLKYLAEEKGIAWIKKTFAEYFGKDFLEPVAVQKISVVNHMGWHEQGDGKLYLGISVSSGRIKGKIRAGLKSIIKKYDTNIIVTADQNIILLDIDPANCDKITHELKDHDITLAEDLTSVRLNSIVCVALPTCGKALAESERISYSLLTEIENAMDKYDLLNEKISIRISGCPNNCSRTVLGDIGIVGRMSGHYVIRIGGDFNGTRLNKIVYDKVPENKIVKVLEPMFEIYSNEKNKHEGFGDFCFRYGIDKLTEDLSLDEI